MEHIDRSIQFYLPRERIQTAIDALNLYFRMYLGQYDAIDMLYKMNFNPSLIYDYDKEKARDELFVQIRDVLFPDMKNKGFLASRGIYNELNHPDCMDAYNLMCTIRSAYAWYRDPHATYPTVDYRPPTNKGCCPHAECVIKEENDTVYAVVTMCKEQFKILSDAAQVYLKVLTSDIGKAVAYFTTDSEMLRLAEKAEYYYPGNLSGEILSEAERFLVDIDETEDRYKIC